MTRTPTELMQGMVFAVFGERDRAARDAAIAEIYTEDVVLHDPDGTVRGYGELSAKSPDFKRAYDSMAAFRGDVLPWWQLNEYAFDTFMIRARARG